MAIVFACGWEDAAVTTHWVDVGGVSALDSTIAGRKGTNAARLDLTNSAVQQYLRVGLGLQAVRVWSFRFRCSSLPTGNTRISMMEGTVYDYHIQVQSTGTLIFTAGGTSANSTSPIVANTWYRFDVVVDGTNKLARWSIDGTAQTNPGAPASTQTINTLYLGKSNLTATGAISFYYDNVGGSVTFADYPIGGGSVLGSPETFYPDITGTATFAAPTSTWDGVGTYTAPAVAGGGPSVGGLAYLGRLPERRQELVPALPEPVPEPEPEPQLVKASAAFSQAPGGWASAMAYNDDELVLEMLAGLT